MSQCRHVAGAEERRDRGLRETAAVSRRRIVRVERNIRPPRGEDCEDGGVGVHILRRMHGDAPFCAGNARVDARSNPVHEARELGVCHRSIRENQSGRVRVTFATLHESRKERGVSLGCHERWGCGAFSRGLLNRTPYSKTKAVKVAVPSCPQRDGGEMQASSVATLVETVPATIAAPRSVKCT